MKNRLAVIPAEAGIQSDESSPQRVRSSAHRLHDRIIFRQRKPKESPLGKTMAIMYGAGFWLSRLWIPASVGMTTKNIAMGCIPTVSSHASAGPVFRWRYKEKAPPRTVTRRGFFMGREEECLSFPMIIESKI